jgi:hypothetical protein
MVEPKKYSLDLDTWTVVIITSSISFAAGKWKQTITKKTLFGVGRPLVASVLNQSRAGTAPVDIVPSRPKDAA